MPDNKVLAMYDIRAKQSFIYRSTSVKEIIGGSLIIRDCFKDYLFPSAKECSHGGKGIYGANNEEHDDFTLQGFEKHLQEGYIGEIVYEGGGNFLVIYKDVEIYREINFLFSKKLAEEIGTLQVVSTYIDNLNFDDYKADEERLYAKHRRDEGKQSFISPWGSLPIVQVDNATSEPLTDKVTTIRETKNVAKVSRESKAKYDKFWQEYDEGKLKSDEIYFDNMVEERGKESMLAVIYIDGNNMGAKVSECKKSNYEESVRSLRAFSNEIQKTYIDDRKRDIEEYLMNKYGDDAKRRFVIASGDETTFICNARYAYDIMRLYLECLPRKASACAGAAIFHSHAPYSEAYRIAEECCESGKQKMKDIGITGEACYMDFHYCQGAIGTSLEEIRDEEVGDLISKPWLVRKKDDDTDVRAIEHSIDIDTVEKCKKILNKIGKSNVKGLSEAAKQGKLEYTLEIKRILAHMSKEDRETIDTDFLLNADENMSLIYDMVIFYDIWFSTREDDAGMKERREVR